MRGERLWRKCYWKKRKLIYLQCNHGVQLQSSSFMSYDLQCKASWSHCKMLKNEWGPSWTVNVLKSKLELLTSDFKLKCVNEKIKM